MLGTGQRAVNVARPASRRSVVGAAICFIIDLVAIILGNNPKNYRGNCGKLNRSTISRDHGPINFNIHSVAVLMHGVAFQLIYKSSTVRRPNLSRAQQIVSTASDVSSCG
jgi:hypothetical protein